MAKKYTIQTPKRVIKPRWLQATIHTLISVGHNADEVVRLIYQIAEQQLRLGDYRVPSKHVIRRHLDKAALVDNLEADFDGCNYATLARRYGFSERTIRRLLDDPRHNQATSEQ